MRQTTLNHLTKENAKEKKIIPFEPEKVLIFDLIGAMAHFRNVQTNSSSLSYLFPPPTTICGLIAGILGKKRDTYYSEFGINNIFLSVEILTPLRKSIFTVNYRQFKEDNYAQIPIELVLPLNLEELRYRIYFSINDSITYEQLRETLRKGKAYYPPYLGLSEFLARIEFLGEFQAQKVKKGDIVQVNSIIKAEQLEIVDYGERFSLFPEYMRRYFVEGRNPGPMVKYFYISSGILKIKVNDDIYCIKMNEQIKNICRL